MKRMQKKQKPYWEMNLEELREATKEFDKEFIADTFSPLTPEERKLWNRVKRKKGRPPTGAGTKAISVTVEMKLLAKADRLAKKLKTSRSQLIARGLRRILDDEAA